MFRYKHDNTTDLGSFMTYFTGTRR